MTEGLNGYTRMTQLYNSVFEISMRLLIILNVYKKPMGVDLLSYIDLFNTYGKNYGLSNTNLHGDNELSFSEIDSRRELVKNSIKRLVLQHYIDPIYSTEGFLYQINQSGSALCESMNSDYSREYVAEAKTIFKRVNNLSEKEITTISRKYGYEGKIYGLH